MIVDKHTVALVSIVGNSIDVLGALYLAYDLLGGEHGPLRTLTRGVTYGAFFGAGLGVALGPVFGRCDGRVDRNHPRLRIFSRFERPAKAGILD
jgi:hypothetical protein